MYDTTALKCFKKLERHPGIVRVQDVSIAARNYTAQICRDDMEKAGAFASTYKKYSFIDNPRVMKQIADEIRLTDHFLAPSLFVKRSLEFNGVPPERIHIVPYGADLTQFQPPERKRRKGSRVNFLFAGSIEQRKGIGYLLEAFRQLNNPDARLFLAGGFIGAEALYEPYRPWFTYLGYLPTNRIQEAYRKADVFVFPTMWEGFSLVLPEAMACGLPVICSDHAGSSDIVEDGVDGFIIPAGNLSALKDKIQFFIDHPGQIEIMGKNARRKAEQYSWERYEQQVAEELNAIVTGEKDRRN
jgi:glycosyltransferase involved in cell wall biosynthesis